MRLSVVIPAALLCLAPIACGIGKDEADPATPNQVNGPQPNNAYGGGQGGQPAQPGAQPVPGQPTPVQPGAAPAAPAPGGAPGQYNPGAQPAAGGGQATAIAPIMANVATLPLQAMAQTEAPGMTAEGGGAFAGQFQEGQTLEQPLSLQGGKCYTIIAVGGPGIQELHISLVSVPMPGMAPVPLAQDNGTPGPNPTLGSKKNGGCFSIPSILPMNVPGKVLLKVTKGSGMAAAQVFVK